MSQARKFLAPTDQRVRRGREVGGVGRRRADRRQPGVLIQDRDLERLEFGTRVDAKFVDEGPAGLPILLERVGLAPRAVEGTHQLTAQTLAERILSDERLQLADQLAVMTERQLSLDVLLDAGEP